MHRGGLAWSAENESRWLVTEGGHRILANANFGMWFDSHSSTADALVVESSFLPSEDWCTCHVLSQWFFGSVKLQATLFQRQAGGAYQIDMKFKRGASSRTYLLFGDGLSTTFFRSLIKTLDGPTSTTVWSFGRSPALDSRRRF